MSAAAIPDSPCIRMFNERYHHHHQFTIKSVHHPWKTAQEQTWNSIPVYPWISAAAVPVCSWAPVQVEEMVFMAARNFEAPLPPAAAASSTISSCPYDGNGDDTLCGGVSQFLESALWEFVNSRPPHLCQKKTFLNLLQTQF